jgi:acetyltransferase-like isoleucine patch superfamily enzyme
VTWILSLIVSLAPLNAIRVAALRLIPNVTLGQSVRIGWGCWFAVERLAIGDNVTIGRFNRFVGPVSIFIGSGSQIGARNRFGCSGWVGDKRYTEQGYARTMRIGSDCLVTDNHLFDCAGLVEIGEGTWFAGCASQVWTHGVGISERDVIIGSRCYLGSAVRLAPGARLGNECILSLGSVLSGDLSSARCAMVAGMPAKVIKQLEDDYATGRIERHGANW